MRPTSTLKALTLGFVYLFALFLLSPTIFNTLQPPQHPSHGAIGPLTLVHGYSDDPKTDPVFIYLCCVDGDIPKVDDSSDPVNLCTKSFCETVVKKEADLLESFSSDLEGERMFTTGLNAVKRFFRRLKDFVISHFTGDGDADGDGKTASVYTQHDNGVQVAVLEGEKDKNRVAFLEAENTLRQLVSQSVSSQAHHRMQAQAKRHQFLTTHLNMNMNMNSNSNRNPINRKLWPQAGFIYTLVNPLNLPLSSMDNQTLGVWARAYRAFGTYEKNTCLRFIRDDNAPKKVNVTKIDGNHGFAFGTGLECVRLELGEADPNICLHETGHCLGYGHTQQRPDRGKYVKYSWEDPACLASYIKICRKFFAESHFPAAVEAQNKWKGKCKLPANQAHIRKALSVTTFDMNNDTHIEECGMLYCAEQMIHVYKNSQNNIEMGPVSPKTYDYGSIMQYPFDECMQAKTEQCPGGTCPKPFVNLTPLDIQGLNEAYKCTEIKATFGTVEKSIFVNKELNPANLKKAIAYRMGLDAQLLNINVPADLKKNPTVTISKI